MPNVGFYELSVGMIIWTVFGILPSRTCWTIQSHSNGIPHFVEACRLDNNMNATVVHSKELNHEYRQIRRVHMTPREKLLQIVRWSHLKWRTRYGVRTNLMEYYKKLNQFVFSPGKISSNVKTATFSQSQSYFHQIISYGNCIYSKKPRKMFDTIFVLL